MGPVAICGQKQAYKEHCEGLDPRGKYQVATRSEASRSPIIERQDGNADSGRRSWQDLWAHGA